MMSINDICRHWYHNRFTHTRIGVTDIWGRKRLYDTPLSNTRNRNGRSEQESGSGQAGQRCESTGGDSRAFIGPSRGLFLLNMATLDKKNKSILEYQRLYFPKSQGLGDRRSRQNTGNWI